jgi:predicted glycosyltransferase
MRILFYFNDLSDTSEHFNRLLSICHYLNSKHSNSSILIISGSNLLANLNISVNLNYKRLPALFPEGPSCYVNNSEKLGIRSEMIIEAIHDFKPDVLLVDEVPCGVAGELREAISTLKSHDVKTKIVLLLQDVIDHPKITISDWENQGFYHAIEQDYDQILILGMQEIFHMVREYQFPANIQHKVFFCGYIRYHAEYQHIPSVRQTLNLQPHDQLVVVSATSDITSYHLIATYLQGLALLPNADHIKTAMFIGLDMPSRKRQILLDVAKLNDRVIIQENSNDLMRYLVSANAVVTMGGYDKICEAFSAGTPAVVIPQISASQDEFIRIASMKKLGLVRAIHPEYLTPHALMQLVWKQLQSDPFKPGLKIDLEALPRISYYLQQLTNPKGQSKGVIKHDRRSSCDRRADRDTLKNSCDEFLKVSRSVNSSWEQKLNPYPLRLR